MAAAAAAAPVISRKKICPFADLHLRTPPLFDGTTRLYVAYHCLYAQRAWIARNYKGLQDKIKIVAVDLADRPAWYKEKVYPQNKVPSLEHNNQVKGESLDLDSAKKQFSEELLMYTDEFNKALYSSITSKGDVAEETETTEPYLKLV
ncbi:hypothetical protein ZWY2020_058163 [Hordeum vulgare]|nr:hypothetical protein ZWY2020_058163 [Hordeum vulgare]